ncbi:efflux RND transporter permease subunit [Eisenibacter elegans]|uniref:efflux RND transporter permease subunit n=1 Tax=Eisenibacter elegans TaxID=997 RepID=UPI00041BF78C|nr:efflux RND transporter permease subunit [Eisenibacter elegans]
MRSLIAYFIKYPVSGNAILVLILIFGFFGLTSLKSTLFPERESRVISIQIIYPGAAPEEIEEGVVLKIEDNLKGITGLERVSSVSRENSGTITIEVLKDYDTDLVLQDVKNAVDRVSNFPAEMEPLVIYKMENLSRAINFSISGDVDLRTLKRFALEIENDLRSVEGISKVTLSGYPDEEIEIAFREADLQAYQISFQQATEAVRKANIEVTGGTIKGEREELLIRAKSKAYYAERFKDIVIKTNANGQVVYLRDIADVRDRWADIPDRTYINQQPAALITVENTINEDILFITDYIRDYVKEFNEKNDVVKATIVQDSSINLRQRIELLVNNGIVGAALVIIFLALFLNPSLAFWVSAGLPICFMGMFIVGAIAGLTINVISLFGMILVVGILVDDGIVVAENIYQHFERGKDPITAAIDGTMEVLPSVISAVLTTVIAFSAFFFLDGRVGEFFQNMAFVVITTLLFSLVECALILPAHIAHSLETGKPTPWRAVTNKVFGFIDRVMGAVMGWMRETLYAPVLRFTIRNPLFIVGISIGSMFIVIGAIEGGIIKTTFFPFIDRDNIDINLLMPAGTRENITEKYTLYIEEKIKQVNEEIKQQRPDGRDVVAIIDRRIGPETHRGTIAITLLNGEDRAMPSFVISNRIRELVGEIPGAENLSYGIASAFGKPVSISILGYNKEEMQQAKDEIKAALTSLSSLRDIIDNDQEGLRELNIELKEKAKALGLQPQDIIGQVRQGFFGSEAQRLQRNVDEVRVWLRYDESNRKSISDLEDMRIRLPEGQEIPLRELATLTSTRGVVSISHLDGKREIRVEADLANPNESVTEILADIQTNILPPIMAKYPALRTSYEGQSRESDKTQRSAQVVLPIVFLLMFAVVMMTFRSVWQTAIVFLMIPLGLVGVGIGHYIHGAAISFFSALGMIALVGVMINDSLVFVSAFNGYLKERKPFIAALHEAGMSRFRPILLTTVTTVAGLGPLILERSLQAQFLIPMAISLSYGLLVATFTTLVLLPALLMLANDIKLYSVAFRQFLFGQKESLPSRESLEPAVKELEAEHIQ